MKPARPLVAALAVCALALTACSKGKGYGDDDLGYTPPPSPTESKSPKPRKSKPPPKTEPPKVVAPTRDAAEELVTTVNGYQYCIKDDRGACTLVDVFARPGDIVRFRNDATDSPHSFTLEDGSIDSGPLQTGKEFAFTVELAPGTYNFQCSVVPYMVGGHLTVA